MGWRRGVVAGLIAALVVAIYPATLEYTGMLMTEPLAATLLAGAMLGILWAGDGGRAALRWRLALGAGTDPRRPRPGPPRVPGDRPPPRASSSSCRGSDLAARGRGRRAAASCAAAVVVLGIVVVVAPWTVRNAFALHRFVTVSTGGGQVLYAGTYLPSDGNPEKVGAGVVAEHPELFGPHAVENLRLEQILARLAERTYPGDWNPTRRSRSWARNSWKTTSSTTPANTSASSPRRSAGSGPTAPAR